MSSITIQAQTQSSVNADENLLEWAQKITTDYDMRISLQSNWNEFFKDVLLPTQKDDVDVSGSQDLSGIVKFDYSNDGDASSLTNIFKDPRVRLQQAIIGLSGSEEQTQVVGPASNNSWASAKDSHMGGAANDHHYQSVARGLIGLFKKTATSNQADFQAEFEASGVLDGADNTSVSGEIRIVQEELVKFMGVSGEYGMNVFTSAQLKELFTACAETGRYVAVDVSGAGKYPGANAEVHGYNVLALRTGDCLQIKATVYDATGGADAQSAGLNKRVWLIDLQQSTDGSHDGSSYIF